MLEIFVLVHKKYILGAQSGLPLYITQSNLETIKEDSSNISSFSDLAFPTVNNHHTPRDVTNFDKSSPNSSTASMI